ncbi:hypothetical protein EW145_g6497 [Phellinidium pouzarii]|uniref:Uncharacterized protein n=1 Tax=Phellinidium pouzarii TaxID=167371 RepID=A0A4S4L153_9AGAM|nr:hypothetical protein EW145_g6497 [Phellinidium pouzarii]
MEKRRRLECEQPVRRKEGILSRSKSPISNSENGTQYSQERFSTSPIRTLVPEILIEIFVLAVPRDVEGWLAPEWNRMAPNNVAAVCRYWRDLALSHSALWATFKYSDVDLLRHFSWDKLSLFLARSRRTPLNLTLYDLNSEDKDHSEVASLLRNHQHRCKHLSIRFSWRAIIHMLEGIVELKNMSLLESLHIEWVGINVRIRLQHAPSLTVLHLAIPKYTLDFGDATVLKLTDITLDADSTAVDDCWSLLRICPALINFHVITRVRVNADVYHEDIFNSSLISFRLFSVQSSVTQCFLQPLHFPNLKHLYFDYDNSGVHGLVSRSRCRLESFHLNDTDANQVTRCLELLPNLKCLTVNGIKGIAVRDMILRLTLRSGEQQLCPSLKTMALTPDLCQYAGEVAAMITSRWYVDGTRHLEKVSLDNCYHASELHDMSVFSRLREEGLQI